MDDYTIKIKEYLGKTKDSPHLEGSHCRAYFFDKHVLKLSKTEEEICDDDWTTLGKQDEILTLEKELKDAAEKGANIYQILAHDFKRKTAWLETKIEGKPLFVENVHNMATMMGIDISTIEQNNRFVFLEDLPVDAQMVIAKGMVDYYSETQAKLLGLSQDKLEKYLFTISVLNANEKLEADLFSENVLIDDKNGIGIIDIEKGEYWNKPKTNIFENVIYSLMPFFDVDNPVDSRIKELFYKIKTPSGIKSLQILNGVIIDKLLTAYGVLDDQRIVKWDHLRFLRSRLLSLTGTDVVFDNFIHRYRKNGQFSITDGNDKVVRKV